MKASFNYTGRKRLDNSTFQIEIHEQKKGDSKLKVNLFKENITDIAKGAVTWIEAYLGSKMMRFCLGNWDETDEHTFTLSDFDVAEHLLFRIKIVDESDAKHPIKGWRDRISPVVYDVNGRQKKSVLPVKPVDLGDIAWRLDWEDSKRPILFVNSRINDARNVESIVKNDPDFSALVFPEVIREVLNRLLLVENADEDDENEWITFACNLVGAPFEREEGDDYKNEELVNKWVENVAQKFGQKTELISRYKRFKEGASA